MSLQCDNLSGELQDQWSSSCIWNKLQNLKFAYVLCVICNKQQAHHLVPGRRNEKLLGHKVPKKYILLQDCIKEIAEERKLEGKEPVVDDDTYV